MGSLHWLHLWCNQLTQWNILQIKNHLPLSRLHSFSQNSRADSYHHFVPFALWVVIVELFFNFDGDEIGGDATTDGCLGEGSVAIGLRGAVVLVERVVCKAVGCHIAGEGERVGGSLVGILHDGATGKNAVAANQQGPTINWCWNIAPSLAGILVSRPVVEPVSLRQVDRSAGGTLFVDGR